MTPEIQLFETPEWSIRYFRFGTQGKRPLAILPGLGLTSASACPGAFAARYRAFGEAFDVYVPDRRADPPPGYTVRDMALETEAFLLSLGSAPADLFGISQGGMIAQFVAAVHPALVHAAAFCSTVARVTPEEAERFDEWMRFAQTENVSGLIHAFARLIYSPAFCERLLAAADMTAAAVTPEDLRRFLLYLDAMRGFDALNVLPAVKCPTLVLSGGADRLMRPGAAAELAAALGGVSRVYPGASHALCDELPAVRKDVLSFFLAAES